MSLALSDFKLKFFNINNVISTQNFTIIFSFYKAQNWTNLMNNLQKSIKTLLAMIISCKYEHQSTS